MWIVHFVYLEKKIVHVVRIFCLHDNYILERFYHVHIVRLTIHAHKLIAHIHALTW